MKGREQQGRGLLPSAVVRRNQKALEKGPAGLEGPSAEGKGPTSLSSSKEPESSMEGRYISSAVVSRGQRAVGKGLPGTSDAESCREGTYFPSAVVTGDQTAVGKGPAGLQGPRGAGKGPTSLSSIKKERESSREGTC